MRQAPGKLVIIDLRASEQRERERGRERVLLVRMAKLALSIRRGEGSISLLCEKNSVLLCFCFLSSSFFLLEKMMKKKRTVTLYTGVLDLAASPFCSTREYVRNVLRECSGLVVVVFSFLFFLSLSQFASQLRFRMEISRDNSLRIFFLSEKANFDS